MVTKEDPIKAIEKDARLIGGLALRHQKLKIHKNGAKFSISKNYVDDEVLFENKPYTIIIIPEEVPEKDDPFFNVEKFYEIESNIIGEATMTAVYPYLILDSSYMKASFAVPLDKLREYCPLPRNVELVEIMPGFGAIDIGCTEFRRLQSDPQHLQKYEMVMEPYNQCGIAVRVKFKDKIGSWITDMLLTGKMYVMVAMAVNGFPARLADSITFRDEPTHMTCEIRVQGKQLLVLTGAKIGTTVQEKEVNAFSKRTGNLQVWHQRMKGHVGHSAMQKDVELVLGNCEAAESLKSLGLTAIPVEYTICTDAKWLEGPPEVLEKLKE